jgi:hypothetical protein
MTAVRHAGISDGAEEDRIAAITQIREDGFGKRLPRGQEVLRPVGQVDQLEGAAPALDPRQAGEGLRKDFRPHAIPGDEGHTAWSVQLRISP